MILTDNKPVCVRGKPGRSHRCAMLLSLEEKRDFSNADVGFGM